MGTRYIVRKKGLFGTIYVSSPTYGLYPSTSNNRKDAYPFGNIDKAEKIARKIFADVIEVDYEEDETNQKEKKCEEEG